VIAFLLPDNFPNIVLPLAYSVAMRQMVAYLQGDAINTHLAAGGNQGSWWITIGLSVAVLLLIVVFVFGGIILYSMFY